MPRAASARRRPASAPQEPAAARPLEPARGRAARVAVGDRLVLADRRAVRRPTTPTSRPTSVNDRDRRGRVWSKTSPCTTTSASRRGQVLFSLDERTFRIALDRRRGRSRHGRNQLEALQARYAQKLARASPSPRADVATTRRNSSARPTCANRRVAAADAARRGAPQPRLRARELAALAAAAGRRHRGQLGGDPDGAGRAAIRATGGAWPQRDKAQRDLDHAVVQRADRRHRRATCPPLQPGEYLAAAQGGVQPGRHRARLDRGQPEGDRPHLGAAGQTGRGHGRHLSRPRAGRARSASIAPATGLEFSVLPAQNTIGNWVKVVQRIPVRITRRAPSPATRRCAPA